jgi:hypothetical protein
VRTSVARQRLRQLNAFTLQRVHNRLLSRKWKLWLWTQPTPPFPAHRTYRSSVEITRTLWWQTRFTRGRVREWRSDPNSVTVPNRTHVYVNFFDHKDLGYHLLQLCPKVVKHSVYTYLLTYLRSWALLEELSIVQPLKNRPAFYGTRRFNTVFTIALHWCLSWAIYLQSTTSHPISLRSILILSTHLRPGLPSGLFPSGLPTNILYIFIYIAVTLLGWKINSVINLTSSPDRLTPTICKGI